MIRLVTLQEDQIEAAKTFISIAIMFVAVLMACEALFDPNKKRKRKK